MRSTPQQQGEIMNLAVKILLALALCLGLGFLVRAILSRVQES